mgnify:CR=1 FL=1
MYVIFLYIEKPFLYIFVGKKPTWQSQMLDIEFLRGGVILNMVVGGEDPDLVFFYYFAEPRKKMGFLPLNIDFYSVCLGSAK